MRSLVPAWIVPFSLVPASLALVVAGCASSPPDGMSRDGLDPLFTMGFVPAENVTVAAPAPGRQRAFLIETRFVREDGTILSAPRLTVFPRQRANVQIVNQTAYVKTFDVEWSDGVLIADPVIDVLPTGLVVDVCADRERDRIALAYSVRASELLKPIPRANVSTGYATPLTIQLPRVESSDVAGVRSMVPGTLTCIGGLATSDGAVDVLVRIDEVGLDAALADTGTGESAEQMDLTDDGPADFPLPGAEDLGLVGWLDALGEELRVTVEPVVVASGTPTGQILDAEAARAFRAGAPAAMRRLAFSTRGVVGAGAQCVLDEAFVTNYDPVVGSSGSFDSVQEPRVERITSGVVASIDADGRLELSWSTMGEVATFTTTLANGPDVVTVWLPEVRVAGRSLDLVPGEWLTTFGHRADGSVLAARVRIELVR